MAATDQDLTHTLKFVGCQRTAARGSQLPTDSEGKLLYPFTVKHLGHDTYTLFAATPGVPAGLVHQNHRGEDAATRWPFSRRMPNRSGCGSSRTARSHMTPSLLSGSSSRSKLRERRWDCASGDLEAVYGPGRGPVPVSRVQVNCSTGFSAYGKSIIAIGTDYGVFISDASDLRGWQRVCLLISLYLCFLR